MSNNKQQSKTFPNKKTNLYKPFSRTIMWSKYFVSTIFALLPIFAGQSSIYTFNALIELLLIVIISDILVQKSLFLPMC